MNSTNQPRPLNDTTRRTNFFGINDFFGTIENIFMGLDQDQRLSALSDVVMGSLADLIALVGLVVVGLIIKPRRKAALMGALWMAIFRLSILLFAYCVISHPYQKEFFISFTAIITLLFILTVSGAIIATTLESLRSTLRLRGTK